MKDVRSEEKTKNRKFEYLIFVAGDGKYWPLQEVAFNWCCGLIDGNGKVNITQVATIAVTKTLFKIDLSSRSATRKKKKKKKKGLS